MLDIDKRYAIYGILPEKHMNNIILKQIKSIWCNVYMRLKVFRNYEAAMDFYRNEVNKSEKDIDFEKDPPMGFMFCIEYVHTGDICKILEISTAQYLEKYIPEYMKKYTGEKEFTKLMNHMNKFFDKFSRS